MYSSWSKDTNRKLRDEEQNLTTSSSGTPFRFAGLGLGSSLDQFFGIPRLRTFQPLAGFGSTRSSCWSLPSNFRCDVCSHHDWRFLYFLTSHIVVIKSVIAN